MKVVSSQIKISRMFEKFYRTREILIDGSKEVKKYDLFDASELMEMILMGVPLPPLYMYELRDGRRSLLDGTKRMMAILDFVDNYYVLAGMRFFPQYNGLLFSELPPLVRTRIENFEITIHTILPPVSPEVLDSLVNRLNR